MTKRRVLVGAMLVCASLVVFGAQREAKSATESVSQPRGSGEARAASNGLGDELLAIYQHSHQVMRNQDEAGYRTVFSKARMTEFEHIMEAMQVTSFHAYMARVAEMESRRSPSQTFVVQSAEKTDDKATLKLIAPKGCGQEGQEQDCLMTVTFVKEDGRWKIDDELTVGASPSR